jgi:hypothetical protein
MHRGRIFYVCIHDGPTEKTMWLMSDTKAVIFVAVVALLLAAAVLVTM